MMLPIPLDELTELRLLSLRDADELLSVLTQNRAHLDQWLRWTATLQMIEDVQAYITRFAQKSADDDGFHAGIFQANKLVGGIVCHYINRSSHKSEIGYWLIEDAVGQGLVTQGSIEILRILFEDKQLHRVEVQCGVDNKRSRAVPERLGFVQEGIKRESEWITSRYVDHVVYSMLSREWYARY